MKPLYELADQLDRLRDLEDELDEQTFLDAIEGLEGEIEIKCTQTGYVIKSLSDETDLISGEIKRLTFRKQKAEQTRDRLKQYLRAYMQRTGIKKIPDPIVPVSLIKGRQSLKNDEGAVPPPQFTTIEEVVKVDKRGITAAIKDGAEFPGWRLERGDDSVKIG